MTGAVELGRAWRDRLIASERFRRWAAAFPLTRPIAARRARELFDLCAGFVYSQILVACVRLDLFNILSAGPRSTVELAKLLSLSNDTTERLLAAAVSLRLIARRGGGRYALGPLGAAMVGNAGLAAMIEHHRLLYADLADPIALLRGELGGTGLARYWPYAKADPPSDLTTDSVAPYSALMAASQVLVAEDVLDAYPVSRHRRLLDLGGGDGSFLIRVAARAPHLQLALFDLPPVAALARTRFAEHGISDRATVLAGDFLRDQPPAGADLITLLRVIHDHDDDSALTILRNARASLAESGVLLLAEPMSGTKGSERVGDAYFGFYLLAMGQGRPRTAGQLRDLLFRAGFTRAEALPTLRPLLTGLIFATR
jgi:demethylspheroidene O-methyltransferase